MVFQSIWFRGDISGYQYFNSKEFFGNLTGQCILHIGKRPPSDGRNIAKGTAGLLLLHQRLLWSRLQASIHVEFSGAYFRKLWIRFFLLSNFNVISISNKITIRALHFVWGSPILSWPRILFSKRVCSDFSAAPIQRLQHQAKHQNWQVLSRHLHQQTSHNKNLNKRS